jgi:hypothetical protein
MDAIVCLTRGYKSRDGYVDLLRRNAAVYHVINSKRGNNQYPLIIWHEGNISEEDQKWILSHEYNTDVSFINVSGSLNQPGDEDTAFIDADRFPLGYRRMCRFNTQQIWEWSFRFDYIMRIDEDCILVQSDYDPIEWVKNKGLVFATSLYSDGSYGPTDKSFPKFVENYIQNNNITPRNKTLCNKSIPYTNFFIADVNFWLSNYEIQKFLLSATESPNFIKDRWGDHAVLDAAMNIFNPGTWVVPGLQYYHKSHNYKVKS